MKPIFFITIALLFATSSFAQLEKGTWLVGGSGSFYTYNQTYTTPAYFVKYKGVNLDLSASIGYFPIDKLSIGLRPDVTWEKSHWTQSSPGISGGHGNGYRFSAGPFARYYFLDKNKPFNILTDVCYQFGVNQYLGSAPLNGKYNIFSAKAGIEAFFNSTAGIEILLGYYKKVISINDNSIGIYNNGAFNDTKKGLQISIGFQLHLIKD